MAALDGYPSKEVRVPSPEIFAHIRRSHYRRAHNQRCRLILLARQDLVRINVQSVKVVLVWGVP